MHNGGKSKMKQDLSEIKSEILTAMGHPNRIRILEFLKDGEKCACEIVPALKIEQSNLSRHMKILVQAGILDNWKEGQKVMYKIADKRFIKILDDISTILKNKIKSRMDVLAKL